MDAHAVTFSRAGFRRGAARMVPIALGLAAFGLALGLAAGQKGLSAAEVGLMSALVFAGASQMLAVEIWAQPVPVATLAAAAFVINLRYLMMTPALLPWLGRVDPVRAYASLFFTADENWALAVSDMRDGGRDAAFLLGGGVLLYCVWLAATMLGRVTGAAVEDPRAWGLDFVAVAAFLALLVPMWSGRRDLMPWLVAGAVAVVVKEMVPGTWYLAAGGLAGSVAGALRDGR